jgi:hypothetical protein
MEKCSIFLTARSNGGERHANNNNNNNKEMEIIQVWGIIRTW